MKHTDRFFNILIRVYDELSDIKTMSQVSKSLSSDLNDEDISLEADWHTGIVCIKPEDIENWMDYFDSNKGVKGVEEEGFTETLVFTKKTSYVCVWDRSKFEDKLNEFMKKSSDL